MHPFPEMTEDMLVRSADGENLGAVIRCGERGFEVEKGVFFQHRLEIPYDQVTTIRDGVIYLRQRYSDLKGVHAMLDDSIRKGGYNNQTELEVPPNGELEDADAKSKIA